MLGGDAQVLPDEERGDVGGAEAASGVIESGESPSPPRKVGVRGEPAFVGEWYPEPCEDAYVGLEAAEKACTGVAYKEFCDGDV